MSHWRRMCPDNLLDQGSGCLERKGKECGDTEEGERDEIIPSEPLFEKQNREHDEGRDRDYFLNDLELKTRELDVAEAICGHRQTILEQRESPRDEDRLPQRPVVAVLQMPVPGKCHEDVGQHQEKNRAHRCSLRKLFSRVTTKDPGQVFATVAESVLAAVPVPYQGPVPRSMFGLETDVPPQAAHKKGTPRRRGHHADRLVVHPTVRSMHRQASLRQNDFSDSGRRSNALESLH